MPEFTAGQIFEAYSLIDRAVRDLGKLTLGQQSDLLLDNLDWLRDSNQAKRLRMFALAEKAKQFTADVSQL